MKISDIAEVINETVKEPSKSGIDVFVGLEHYDIAEPVIKRFGSTQMLSTAAKVFKKGDVLIARRNVYLQRASMAPFSGLTSGDSIVLRVKEKLDTEETDYDTMSKLLPFILNSVDFWDYANTNADGTMSKRLSPALLLDYEFDLPSIEEQKLRAEKLWAAYEVKQSYLEMLKATQEMVQSQFIEMVGELRTNTKGWPIKALPELATYSIGLTYKPEDVFEEGIIVLRSGNIQDSKLILDDVVRVKCPIKETLYILEDDILMCSRNGSAALVGKVAQIKEINEPMTYGAFMTVIRSDYSDFLFLYFQSNDFREQVSTGKSSTMNQITQNMLDKISVPFPDEDTRNRLSEILHQADKSEFELRQSIDAIDKIINSLINQISYK